MKYWTNERKISFWFHCVTFAVPMIVSLVSAILFWQRHTGNLLIAFIAIGLIELISLSSLVMHLLGIPTKFYWLKQALPYVSSIAIAELLWNVFSTFNSAFVAVLLTSVSVCVVIVWIIHSVAGIEESVKSYQVQTPDGILLASFRQLRQQQEAKLLANFEEAAEQYLDAQVLVVDAGSSSLAKTYPCPNCGAALSQGKYGAAKRNGFCSLCRNLEENS